MSYITWLYIPQPETDEISSDAKSAVLPGLITATAKPNGSSKTVSSSQAELLTYEQKQPRVTLFLVS